MKTTADCATDRVVGDEAYLRSWFSSVQAATHNERATDTRAIQHSGWSVFIFFLVSSPLIGILLAILGLAIFPSDTKFSETPILKGVR